MRIRGGGILNPCTHEHSEDENCYRADVECIHNHTDKCNAAEEEEGGEESSRPDKKLICTHECSEESGCIKKVLDCPHERGEHDGECGYEEAEEGAECTYNCKACGSEGSLEEEDAGLSGGNTKEEDSGLPGGNQAEEILPDAMPPKVEDSQEECACTERCTEESIDEECPVCSKDDADLEDCSGEEELVPEENLIWISAFDELEEEVRQQPVAAKTALASLNLPERLNVTGYQYEEASPGEASVPKSFTISGVAWELSADWNDGVTEYDDQAETGGYIFTPVLPEGWALEEGVDLPWIMVMVGAVETEAVELGLEVGGTYYFDLANRNSDPQSIGGLDQDIPGDTNEALPDKDLHYVPFTFAGAVDSYSLINGNNRPGLGSYGERTGLRNLFIADYVVKVNVTWQELSDFYISAGGGEFNCRLNGISVYLRAPSAGNNNSGGITPANNEWDKIREKITIKNNEIGSFGQEDKLGERNSVYRGGAAGAAAMSSVNKQTPGTDYGYRPVIDLQRRTGEPNLSESDIKTLELDLNGAMLGGMEKICLVTSASNYMRIPAAIPQEGKEFKEWNSEKNGSGTAFAPGAEVSADLVPDCLYAQWKRSGPPPAEHELYFNGENLFKDAALQTPYDGNAGRYSIDPATKTLTLGGDAGPFVFETNQKNALNIVDCEAVIQIKAGTANEIISTHEGGYESDHVTGVKTGASLTMKGEGTGADRGSLTITSGTNTSDFRGNSTALYAAGNVTLDNAVVALKATKGTGCNGLYISAAGKADLILKNEAELTAESGQNLIAPSSGDAFGTGITITNGRVKLEGAGSQLTAKGETAAVKLPNPISSATYDKDNLLAGTDYEGTGAGHTFAFSVTEKIYKQSDSTGAANIKYISLTSIASDPEGFSGGHGVADDPYIIGKAQDLEDLAAKVNGGDDYEGKYFRIDGEANALNTSQVIGGAGKPFNGIFDGNGKTVALDIRKAEWVDYQGFFGYIGTKGEVRNLGVSGNVKGSKYVGGVAAFNSGKVENCFNTAAILGNSYIGGVAGCTSGADSIVKNCYNTGKIEGGTQAGGVAGGVESGSNGLMLCYNTADVKGTSELGGIVGLLKDSTLKDCVSLGMKVSALTQPETAGRVAGKIDGSSNVVSGNKARKDMKTGLKDSETVKTGGTDMDGADTALGDKLSDVFASPWDTADIWKLPARSSKLEIDKALPTLRKAPQSPAPVLPGFVIEISRQPSAKTVVYGAIGVSDTLETMGNVKNHDSMEVKYQWYSATNESKAGEQKVDGAENKAFQIPADLEAGEYFYFCRLSNPDCVDKDTNVVKVTVSPADYNGAVAKTVLFKAEEIKDGPKSDSLTVDDFFGDNPPEGREITAIQPMGSANVLTSCTLEGGLIKYTSKSGIAADLEESFRVTIKAKNYKNITTTLKFKTIDKTLVTVEGITVEGIAAGEKTYDGTAAAYVDAAKRVTVTEGGLDVTAAVGALVYTWQKKDESGSFHKVEEAPKDAGSYRLVAAVAGTNKDYMGELNVDFVIGKKEISVGPEDEEITAGDPMPVFKLKYDGLVEGETLSPSIDPEFTCGAAVTDTAGSYAITWGNMDSTGFTGSTKDNYDIVTFQEGTLTIAEKDEPSSFKLTINGSYAVRSGAGTYAPGTKITIQAGVREDYTFTGWTAGEEKWYYFDDNGKMKINWLRTKNDTWYYLDPREDIAQGALYKGVLKDPYDGNLYYLDPATGMMMTGWQQIDGKWYYFNPAPAPRSGWVVDAGLGEWIYQNGTDLPYGAALRNTRTPDGHYVDGNGVLIS